jgi:flavorubredoxin
MSTADIDEIVDGIYRISSCEPGSAITYNQFLIDDDRPALIHTGMHHAYEQVRSAIAQVIDPDRLHYVILLHFEADECGGMDRFLDAAPESTLVGSELSVALNLSGWNYRGRFEGNRDGDLLELGRHRIRFLETPHVHHWDSMMLFEETTGSLFPSDLYIQPGAQPPTVTENLADEMCDLYRASGIFAHERPVREVVDRIEQLKPAWMHAMHGGTLTREVIPRYSDALRKRGFAYNGRLLGRPILPTPEPSRTADGLPR